MTTRDREDEPFLARWSRLKRAGRGKDDTGPTPAAPPAGAASAPSPAKAREEVRPQGEPDPPVPLELPDPDTLDAGADFRVFLREGVPEELKIRALRRLWRVNPIISSVSPLVDYAEDYTDKATVVADLKSVFKEGLRVLDRLADLQEAKADAGEAGGRDETMAAAAAQAEKDESNS
jgi:hypothetical protein